MSSDRHESSKTRPAHDWMVDSALPTWTRRERHRRVVVRPTPGHIAAAHDVTWGELPFTRALLNMMGSRSHRLDKHQRVLTMFTDHGWHLIHRDDRQLLVAGLIPTRRSVTAQLGGRLGPPTVAEAGHTPGHLSVLIHSGEWRVLCVGDVMYTLRHLDTDAVRPIMLGKRARTAQLVSIDLSGSSTAPSPA